MKIVISGDDLQDVINMANDIDMMLTAVWNVDDLKCYEGVDHIKGQKLHSYHFDVTFRDEEM